MRLRYHSTNDLEVKLVVMPEQERKRREMTLRIPIELKDRLENIARKNKRSLTKEIELVLEKYAAEFEEGSPDSKVVS